MNIIVTKFKGKLSREVDQNEFLYFDTQIEEAFNKILVYSLHAKV